MFILHEFSKWAAASIVSLCVFSAFGAGDAPVKFKFSDEKAFIFKDNGVVRMKNPRGAASIDLPLDNVKSLETTASVRAWGENATASERAIHFEFTGEKGSLWIRFAGGRTDMILFQKDGKRKTSMLKEALPVGEDTAFSEVKLIYADGNVKFFISGKEVVSGAGDIGALQKLSIRGAAVAFEIKNIIVKCDGKDIKADLFAK
ncbi:MAG: hypothetical protein BWY31_01850 [Lentisphaerae bacterium ADurb.Bin242]|nr:MAG: hypothetical protein BWY31_01850 [Lentisphaerae bacterium ADurb.Bin242]